MQKAQNRAARWITGGFSTTPHGALEMTAELLPMRHQIDKLMKRACLRTRTLHNGHPTIAQLPKPTWMAGPLSITPPMPLQRLLQDDATTPMTHIAVWGSASNENFDLMHNECRPGDQLLDAREGQILAHLEYVDGVPALPQNLREKSCANGLLDTYCLSSRRLNEIPRALRFTLMDHKNAMLDEINR